MATIDDFRYVLEMWKSLEIPRTVRREINIDINAEKIITIAGVRRSGKTSLDVPVHKTTLEQRDKKKQHNLRKF